MFRQTRAPSERTSRSAFVGRACRPESFRCHFTSDLTSGAASKLAVIGGGMYPKDYLFTKEHEWIKADGAVGTIGITDYAQQELGDVVFVELPKVGAQVKA